MCRDAMGIETGKKMCSSVKMEMEKSAMWGKARYKVLNSRVWCCFCHFFVGSMNVSLARLLSWFSLYRVRLSCKKKVYFYFLLFVRVISRTIDVYTTCQALRDN